MQAYEVELEQTEPDGLPWPCPPCRDSWCLGPALTTCWNVPDRRLRSTSTVLITAARGVLRSCPAWSRDADDGRVSDTAPACPSGLCRLTEQVQEGV